MSIDLQVRAEGLNVEVSAALCWDKGPNTIVGWDKQTNKQKLGQGLDRTCATFYS